MCGSLCHHVTYFMCQKIGGLEGELFIPWWQVDPAECLPQQHPNLQHVYVSVAKNNSQEIGQNKKKILLARGRCEKEVLFSEMEQSS